MINYSLINVAVTNTACGKPDQGRDATTGPRHTGRTGGHRRGGALPVLPEWSEPPWGTKKQGRAPPELTSRRFRCRPGVPTSTPVLLPHPLPAGGTRIPAEGGCAVAAQPRFRWGASTTLPRAPLFVAARSLRKLSTSIAPPGDARTAGGVGGWGTERRGAMRSPAQVRPGADPRSYLGQPGRVPARWRPPTPPRPVPPCLKAAP